MVRSAVTTLVLILAIGIAAACGTVARPRRAPWWRRGDHGGSHCGVGPAAPTALQESAPGERIAIARRRGTRRRVRRRGG